MAKEKALANSLPDKPKKIEDYEVENALSTLERAHEHHNNPALMKRVKKLAGRKVKTYRSLQQVKDAYNDKYGKSHSEAPDHDTDD